MKIGFFGCGNMGAALALGIKKKLPQVELHFYTPSQTKAQELALKTEGHFVAELTDMPKTLDWYILGFKPQSLSEFHFSFSKEAKVLSLLAGVGLETLSKKFAITKIARLMPNTPSSLGKGANLFFSPPGILIKEVEEIKNLLEALGKLYIMESEEQMDQLTPFSGSGPALIFELARIFEKHLMTLSGGHKEAKEIIAQTFLGSAFLMNESPQSFVELREQVTSKKGVTYEALKTLEDHHLEETFEEAFLACGKRLEELKNEMSLKY